MKKPNQLNTYARAISVYTGITVSTGIAIFTGVTVSAGITVPFYCYFLVILYEFDKMQIPSENYEKFLLFQLVWRLLEFAFLCAYFGRRIFYFSF